MSGIFVAVPFGVMLWAVLLGWLITPWLSIACAVVLVFAVIVAIHTTRERA